MYKLKGLGLTLILLCCYCLSQAAYNVHVFRNDGKYNVYDKEKIDTIRLHDALVDFKFKNGSEYTVDRSAVDSLKFMDTCLIAEVFITTDSVAEISRDTYVGCSIVINGHNIFPSDSLHGKIRGRGNSTWLWYDKKPYRLKLDKKSKMLGLKKAKDWALMANYRDPTYLMNAFTFELADYLGMQYTNHSRFCNVYLNGSYVGLYQLTEQIKQGSNRVEVNDDGGILLSLDVDDGPGESPDADDNFYATMSSSSSSSSSEETSPFGGRGGMGGMGGWGQQQQQSVQIPVCIKYPEDSVMLANKQAIQDSFAILTTAIMDHDYAKFSQLMDVQSFIDFILINEITDNVELEAPRSMYLYRYNGKDSLWHMGPVWDFDGGFSFDWTDMYTSRKYFTKNTSLIGSNPTSNTNGVSEFFIEMFNSSEFVDAYKARWNAVKDNMLPMLFTKIENYKLQIKCAAESDEEKWSLTTDFDEQFDNLESWLTARIKMLDTTINNY